MGTRGLGLAERRSVLVAAREALADVAAVVHEASDEELGELMGELDAVTALGGAARAVVAVEAVRRGVVAGSGMNAHAWVRECAPSLRQGGAGQVARLAVEVANVARAAGSFGAGCGGGAGAWFAVGVGVGGGEGRLGVAVVGVVGVG